jgi:hypothetical protein
MHQYYLVSEEWRELLLNNVNKDTSQKKMDEMGSRPRAMDMVIQDDVGGGTRESKLTWESRQVTIQSQPRQAHRFMDQAGG